MRYKRWIKLKKQFSLGYLAILVRAYCLFSPKSVSIINSRAKKIRTQLIINAILDNHFQDAKRKKNKSYHWGNIGWDVANATTECEIILRWPDSEDTEQYFARVLPAISNLAKSYRHNTIDESGYALGTVREIESALILQAQHSR